MSWPYELEVETPDGVRTLTFKTLDGMARELAHLNLEGVQHARTPNLSEAERDLVTSLAARRVRRVQL